MQTDKKKSDKVGLEDCSGSAQTKSLLILKLKRSKGDNFKAKKYTNYEDQLFF